MDELISRRAAIDALEEPCKVSDTWTDEYAVGERMQWEKDVRTLNNLPTIDAVPVVRCKDCDWWDRIDDGSYGYCHSCKHGFYSANWEISIYRRYKEDFFCADGERRTDATN